MGTETEAERQPPLAREIQRFDWGATEWRASLFCLPAIATALLAGIAAGHPGAALVMAGGAQCVGFGSFQKPLGFREGPMVLATIATAVSATVGEVSADHPWIYLAVVAVWAFAYGMSGAISSPASWVGQQATIFMVVSSAVPGPLGEAAMRGLGVLAGGTLQTLLIMLCWRYWRPALSAIADPETHPPGWQRRAILQNLTLRSAVFRYSLRLTVTAAIAVLISRWLGFLNAYWVPMTAIIILKPHRRMTNVRAVSRVAGTILGGVLSTMVAVAMRPAHLPLTVVIVVFIYVAYALQNVNYGAYAIFLTGYIVFLLSLARMPQTLTVYHRVVATAIGGALGMLAYAIHWNFERMRTLKMVASPPGPA
jgi:uncharacterized membrane protein YccC